eukprot:TRINITY_DN12534_c0_g1_i1.p1 TRINITY_DN12534_c0_g1~~TRINITY_DN12534_c0_g1_i1.p1  ORF type:complete len:253 (+),score=47.97 TRINITY_DN12534_c0_g1_i1:56-814(+)
MPPKRRAKAADPSPRPQKKPRFTTPASKKKAGFTPTPFHKGEVSSELLLPSFHEVRKKTNQFSFKKAVTNFLGGLVTEVHGEKKNGVLTITAKCPGKKKDIHSIEIVIDQTPREKDGRSEDAEVQWTGKCDCGSKNNPCSHQATVLFQFEDSHLVASKARAVSLSTRKELGSGLTGLMSPAELKRYNKEIPKCKALTANVLKGELRENGVPMTGTKDILSEKVSSGRIKGAIARCPQCHGAQLSAVARTSLE